MKSRSSFPRSAWERLPRRSASLLLALLAGCTSGPNEQLSSCQKDKEQLLATISRQRDELRTAREERASLEARLDHAEKELARSAGGTRVSSRPVEVTPLPWRSPQ
jgi:septal ring factor EnvC (AmiA/AmiB activator)